MRLQSQPRERSVSSLPVPVADALSSDVSGDGATGERNQRAHAMSAALVFALPDGTMLNRAPKDMCSWEILASYRLAWHLAYFLPSVSLAQPLANWLCLAQGELERRGEWRPEVLPPHSM